MEKSGKFRLTSLERNWILYDVGNSAFVLMVATLIPIFFNALAESGGLSSVEYLAYWGYASSAVTVITAVLSPILGTVADTKGFKKPIFILCVFVGIVGCCAMGAVSAWLPFLVWRSRPGPGWPWAGCQAATARLGWRAAGCLSELA